ncbi:MAG: arginase family protein [Bacillota bacterium]|nr:arginase family protein [Bacillota bacterium]
MSEVARRTAPDGDRLVQAGPLEPGLAYTGIATFLRLPWVPRSELGRVRPEAAVVGVPYDWGVGYRPGARSAPRAVRDASTRYALPPEGLWDVESGRWLLAGAKLVDTGDVDVVGLDPEETAARVTKAVAEVREAGAIPFLLGGDHSLTFAAVRGLAPLFAAGSRWPGRALWCLQFDAHLDFRQHVGGVRLTSSSPMRRITELGFVKGVVDVGVRGLRALPEDVEAQRAAGGRLVLAREVHERMRRDGAEALVELLEPLPPGEPVYVTFDIDALDPSIAPGCSSPEPDGLTLAETRALLRGLRGRNPVVGCDLTEVNPYFDPAGVTALTATLVAIEMLAAAVEGGRYG